MDVERLHALRTEAAEEIVLAVQAGADWTVLNDLAAFVQRCDDRLERQTATRDPLESRIRIAATKSPTLRGTGGRRSE